MAKATPKVARVKLEVLAGVSVAWVRLSYLETTGVLSPSEANPLIQKGLRWFPPRRKSCKPAPCRRRAVLERGAWGQFFVSEDKFLSAAAQLEFILEFNSYIFEGVRIPEVQGFREMLGNIYFAYLPDFWTSRLDPVVPIAERFYDILSQSDEFPEEFSIDKKAMD